MTHVRIFPYSKTAMQSGRACQGQWTMTIVAWEASYQDALMGWQASTAPFCTKNLTFASLEEAVAFAKAKNWTYDVEAPKGDHVHPKQYGSHFRADKPLY
ncbi:MAG: oxidoreductase [Candidatus Puniceispirillum sp.]|nr:oxidoreductase [Candidatus Puniceispirillum sp.]